jgi:hypothetical protein
MNALRNILAQRTVVIPALSLIIGIILHARGLSLTDGQQASLQQQIATVFDLIALIAGVSSARYSVNSQKIEAAQQQVEVTRQAVNVNANQLDTVTKPSLVAAKVPDVLPPLEKKQP